MTHRDRVLKTFRFEPTDRLPCDLSESKVWPELMDYFRQEHCLADEESVRGLLDLDFVECGATSLPVRITASATSGVRTS